MILFLLALVAAHEVVWLTDKTFEHDTQATTGSTTGDWLVYFCEPAQCAANLETWASVRNELFGYATVAAVDTSRNPKVTLRFGFEE